MTITRQEPGFPEPPAPQRPTGRAATGRAPGRSGGTIRRRVARILALPAVVVLLLLAIVAAGQIQDYRDSQATSRSVTLALAIQDLTHELQTERGVTAGVLGGNNSFLPELKPARRQVDEQRAKVAGLVTGSGDADSRVSAALRQLDGLASVRAATDAASAGRAAAFDYYTDRIAALSDVEVGLDNTGDEELRRGVSTLQALADLTEATSQERAFLNGVFSAGGFAKGEFVRFAAMRADREAALERFNRFATPSQRAANAFVLDTGAAQLTAEFEQVAIDAADGRRIVVNPQSWWSGLTTVLDDLRQLQQHVGSEIQVRAHDLQQSSAQRIGLLVGFVLLCFAGSIYLAALASMSITRPLATLAAEADNVAAERLPESVRRVQASDPEAPPTPPAPVKVPARATEEVRSVATALDRLQAAAYGLATEQAMQRRDTIESLANLGRRNQNLIRRQLGFITSLEREEIDPAALANLFELDHLATRMRRNAASLLVLVDASSPRQWSQAVSVADVIRAAVSEVEEYRRVSLRRVDDAMVSGSAIGSIAHLLSELIENGLTFSPPDTEVEVQGRRLGDGYLIAITDQGVGMSQEDLRKANSRLRGEGDFIAAPTRFLGHFVVGKLAHDTGIEVQLLPSPVTGVTARVTLPASLLSAPTTVQVSSVTAAGGTRHQDADAERRARLAPAGRLALAPLPEPGPPTPAPGTPYPVTSPAASPSAPAAASSPSGPAAAPAPAAAPVGATALADSRLGTRAGAGQGASNVPAASTLPPAPERHPAAAGSGPLPTATTSAPTSASASASASADGAGPGRAAAGPQTGSTPTSRQDDPDSTPPSGMSLSAHPAWGPPVSWPPAWDLPKAGRTPPPAGQPISPRRAAGSTGSTAIQPAARPVPSGADSNGQGFDGQAFDGQGFDGQGSNGYDSSGPDAGGPGNANGLRSNGLGSANGLGANGHGPHSVAGSEGLGGQLDPAGQSEQERTRNGLRKRTPRTPRGAGAPTGETRQVIDLDSVSRTPALVNDSPAQVGARLTALRAGMQRGRETPVASTPRPGGGAADHESRETE